MNDPLVGEIRQPHQGMPPLDPSGPPVSFFEFWPQYLFYAPMCLYWAWLSLRFGGMTLPTVANPSIPFGGWIGESKARVFEAAGPQARAMIPPWRLFRRTQALDATEVLAQAHAAGVTLPCIAKPDKGCRGVGVRRIRNRAELAAYIQAYPDGEDFLLQQLVDHEAEAGIFYVRAPEETAGRILSVTLKYFPYVRGDGASTLEQLIRRDPRAGRLVNIYLPRHAHRLGWVVPEGQPVRIAYAGSHSRGTIFRNGNSLATPAMTEAFDRIARDIEEFHFGRFDVRFTDIQALQQGKGFSIVEINGAGAEATHVWDRKTTLGEAYRALMQQYRLLWQIGASNARRGFRPESLSAVIGAYRQEKALWARYPLTE
ncbi:MAG: D-alanine--D-alanine ligase [Alphaproteobacteria bacterium]